MSSRISNRPVHSEVPATQDFIVKRADVVLKLVPEVLLAPSNLVKELNAGLSTYVGTIQNAIMSDLRSRLIKILDSWFPDLDKHHGDKILKKVVNSCLSPGASGFNRTLDALQSCGYWDHNSSPASFTAFMLANGNDAYGIKVRRISAYNLKCAGCEKHRNVKLMLKVTRGERYALEVTNWHSDCLATFILRDLAKSFRSAKGSLDKQSIAVNAILSANKKNPILKGKKAGLEELGAASQYESWVDQLFYFWSKTSDLKGESKASYQSSFNEYSSAIAQYAQTGTFPVDATKQRLSKHFDSKVVDSVIDQFLTPRQIQILETIKDSHNQNGFAPTLREIGSRVGLSSADSVNYQLEILRDKGYLRLGEKHNSGAAPKFESENPKFDGDAFPASEPTNIVSIDAKNFRDARRIGEVYRKGIPVILNCSQMQEGEGKRLVDFASGLVLGFNGSIEKIAHGVFLLTPPDGVVTPKENSAASTLVN